MVLREYLIIFLSTHNSNHNFLKKILATQDWPKQLYQTNKVLATQTPLSNPIIAKRNTRALIITYCKRDLTMVRFSKFIPKKEIYEKFSLDRNFVHLEDHVSNA